MKFLWSLYTDGRYKEQLPITTKTVTSDIWLLYKESIIFHLITHDTDSQNKSACIFVRKKKRCCDKTTYK